MIATLEPECDRELRLRASETYRMDSVRRGRGAGSSGSRRRGQPARRNRKPRPRRSAGPGTANANAEDLTLQHQDMDQVEHEVSDRGFPHLQYRMSSMNRVCGK